MRLIGRKSEYFILSALMTLLLLVASILTMMKLGEDGSLIIIIVLLAAGMLLFNLYFILFLPGKIVFYDEEKNTVCIYTSRWKCVNIALADIKRIDLESPWIRAFWKSLDITLNNGEVISTTGISKENEIIESLMVIKK